MIRPDNNHATHPLSCETCEYFAENKDDHGSSGQCRYDPPKVFMVPMQKHLGGVEPGFMCACPTVHASFWCGCYAPRCPEVEENNP